EDDFRIGPLSRCELDSIPRPVIAFFQTKLPDLLTAPPAPFKTLLTGLAGAFFLAGAVMGYSQQPSARNEGRATLSRLWTHAALTAALGWLLCGMWNLWHLPLTVFVLHSGLHLIGRSFRKRNAIWFAGLHGTLLILLGIAAVQLARIPGSGGFWVDIWGERYLKAVIFLGGFAAVRIHHHRHLDQLCPGDRCGICGEVRRRRRITAPDHGVFITGSRQTGAV
ncbi:MAG: hypothetical protein ACLFQY_02270, partial [Desulfococcaceae bacterium]